MGPHRRKSLLITETVWQSDAILEISPEKSETITCAC